MSGTPRFAVMGSGNGARAFCGQIAALGLPVRMFEPLEATADFLKLKEVPEILLEGDSETIANSEIAKKFYLGENFSL